MRSGCLLEAPAGFEPTNEALLASALDHLATAPLQIYSNIRISRTIYKLSLQLLLEIFNLNLKVRRWIRQFTAAGTQTI
jgi:hypothetical protein